ncbi:MAG: SapC family protein, partial [Gammaproteobacteria bacterium]|nr:SapC family protein [Gammaproteobacteria bacterium]
FASAGLDYPIIFTGPDRVPLAVLGMRAGQNLFIGDDGVYEPNRYVPAFIRRYPFVFAEDKANNRFV